MPTRARGTSRTLTRPASARRAGSRKTTGRSGRCRSSPANGSPRTTTCRSYSTNGNRIADSKFLAMRLDDKKLLVFVSGLVVLICALYGVERSALEMLGHDQHPHPVPPWLDGLPAIFFLQNAGYTTQFSLPLLEFYQIVAVSQSVLLAALYLVLRRLEKTQAWIFIGLGAIFMLALALRAVTMSSEDIYSYIGPALAQPSAYQPGPVPFAGEQAVINQIWGLTLLPNGYGPLWIGLSQLTVKTAH